MKDGLIKSMFNLSLSASRRFKVSLFVLLVISVAILTVPLSSPANAADMNTVLNDIRAQFKNNSSPTPVISDLVHPDAVGAYQKFEISFTLAATYDNPFDPEDINVEGHFIYPDGSEVVIPGFYYDVYETKNGKTTTAYKASLYNKTNDSGWKIRFSSGTAGAYRFYITAKDSLNQVGTTAQIPFTITTSDSKGYVQVSETNPKYFENSADGSLFYGSGSNIPYINAADIKNPAIESYEHFIGKAKGNSSVTRVWICNWRWLEWMPDPANVETFGYGGLNYYNQAVASMVDRVYDLAEQSDLKVMLALDDNNEIAIGTGYEGWDFHPYSAANGGPALDVADYWTNDDVRKIYKNRIRYIAARWGYSSSMWALNQWNDMSNPDANQIDYLTDMKEYVHTIFDGWRPIIYGSNFGSTADEQMDYAQFGKTMVTDKPGVVQESYYSADLNWFNSVLQDTQWEGLVRGNAARMVWRYMDVEALNSWPIFKSLLNFVSDIPLNKKEWNPLIVNAASTAPSDGTSFTKIIEVAGYGDIPSFGVKAPENMFYVNTEDDSQFLMGFAAGSNYQGHVLYGFNEDKVDLRNPPTFIINVPESGKMLVRAKEVDAGPHRLITTVNGASGPSLEWNFDVKTHLKPLSKEEQFIEIPLIKGENRIQLDCDGPSFIRLANIYFILDTNSPHGVLSINGLVSEGQDDAFVYIKNQTYTELYHTVLEKESMDVSNFQCEVPGLKDGSYNIVFYDPSEGDYIGKTTADTVGGTLSFTVSNISKDLAIKIREVSLPIEAYLEDALKGISMNTGNEVLYKGQTLQLAVSANPADAAIPEVQWTSSNVNVARVSVDGLVTANDFGTVTIIATVTDPIYGGEFTAQCSVRVVHGYTPIISDTFNDDTPGEEPTNWTIVKGDALNSSTVIDETDVTNPTGEKGVLMDRATSSGAALQAWKGLGGLTGNIRLETKVYVPDKSKLRVIWIANNNTSPANIIRIALANDGYIKAQNGTTQAETVRAYTDKTWIGLKIDLNTSTGYYDLYINIDGEETVHTFKTAETSPGTPVSPINFGHIYFSLQESKTNKIDKLYFDDVIVSVPVKQVENIDLDVNSATLYQEELLDTIQLNAAVTPEDATNKTLNWTSSNETIATVTSNGLVKAIGAGTAIIRASVAEAVYGSVYDECTVTVMPITVSSVSLDKGEVTLEATQTEQLSATVLPENASDKRVTWSSSDDAVASVDSNGLVTAVGVGTATIRATSAQGSVYDESQITVIPTAVVSMSLDKTNIVLIAGTYNTINAVITPNNATSRNVTWTSGDNTVATVDSTGRVTGKKAGETVITAILTDTTSGLAYSESCNVSVLPYEEIYDDFNSLVTGSQPDGWMITEGKAGNTVTVVDGGSGDKWVSMNKPDISATALVAGRDFYGLNGRVVLEARINGQVSNAKARIMYVYNTSGNAIIRFALGYDTKIKVSNGSNDALDSGLTYTANTWYRLKFDINTETGSYDLYINDSKVNNESYSLMSNSFNVGKMEFRLQSKNNDVLYFDDIVGYLVLPDTGEQPAVIPVTAIDVIPEPVTLSIGQTAELSATITPNNATYKELVWTSADSTVAEVTSNGWVTGKKVGETFITASVTDAVYGSVYSANCIVIVMPTPVTNVTMDTTPVSLAEGSTKQLMATIEPSDATEKGIHWISSNEEVATVSQNGLVTAKKAGTAEIRAVSIFDQSIFKECIVTVTAVITPPVEEENEEDGNDNPVQPAEPPVQTQVQPKEEMELNISSAIVTNTSADGTKTAVLRQEAVTELEKTLALGGTVTIKVEEAAASQKIEVPAELFSKAETKSAAIVMDYGNVKLNIPAEAVNVEALAKNLDLASTEGATISIGVKEVDMPEVISSEGLTPVGKTFEFSLTINTRDGKSTYVDTFSKPIKLQIPVDHSKIEPAVKGTRNVYRVDVNPPSYRQTYREGDNYVAELTGFSKYALLDYNGSFEDVDGTHWAKDYIKVIAAKSITAGVEDNRFAPSEKVTRAQFATFIARALNLKTDEYTGVFSDVAKGTWYAPYVEAAAKAGIVSGVEEGKFDPDAVITREQMATLTMRAYAAATGKKLSEEALKYKGSFSDLGNASSWAVDAIKAAQANGIINGMTDTTFAPQETSQRDQTAAMLVNLLKAMGRL